MKGLNHQSLSPAGYDNDVVYKAVKTEAVDFVGPPPPISANLSCFAGKDDQSFLVCYFTSIASFLFLSCMLLL